MFNSVSPPLTLFVSIKHYYYNSNILFYFKWLSNYFNIFNILIRSK